MRSLLLLSLLMPSTVACTTGIEPLEEDDLDATATTTIESQLAHGYKTTRYAHPPRTAVYDAAGKWVATFTDHARTVRLKGPVRTLHERSAVDVQITHYVRVLPSPFDGTIDVSWLDHARAETSPDVIALSLQYIEGAPARTTNGLQIAGDASYGPLVDGTRQEGSDFSDYLGLTWTYPDGQRDTNEPAQLHSLDCSGFIRMVWGYRAGIPMTGRDDGEGHMLPRRAVQIAATGPGVLTLPNNGTATSHVDDLYVGDLVFFDASTDDGTAIDHIGMYIGLDVDGHPRFISSRKTINGPTFGDEGGSSKLDGTSLYARTFRAARRL